MAVVTVALIVLHGQVFGRDGQDVDVALVIAEHDRVLVRRGGPRDGHETLRRVLYRLHGEDALRNTDNRRLS